MAAARGHCARQHSSESESALQVALQPGGRGAGCAPGTILPRLKRGGASPEPESSTLARTFLRAPGWTADQSDDATMRVESDEALAAEPIKSRLGRTKRPGLGRCDGDRTSKFASELSRLLVLHGVTPLPWKMGRAWARLAKLVVSADGPTRLLLQPLYAKVCGIATGWPVAMLASSESVLGRWRRQ